MRFRFHFPFSQIPRPFWVWMSVAGFLGSAWAMTAFIRFTPPQSAESAGLSTSVQHVQAQFQQLLTSMEAQANRVMAETFVQKCLTQITAGDYIEYLTPAQQDAIRYFKALNGFDPAQTSIELYDLRYHLLAWHGVSLPISEAQRRQRFPDAPTFQLYTAQEDGSRALEYWVPVMERNTVIGGLRIVQLVQMPTPQDQVSPLLFEDQVHARLQRPVRINWRSFSGPTNNPSEGLGALITPQGQALGSVHVLALSDQELSEIRQSKQNDLAAFWLVLLSAWLLFGCHQMLAVCKSGWARGAWIGVMSSLWWGFRYVLIALEVPRRWILDNLNLDRVFSPRLMATDFGNGLAQSIGDLLLTAFFGLVMVLYAAYIIGTRFSNFSASPRFWWKSCLDQPRRTRPLLFFLGWLPVAWIMQEVWNIQAHLVFQTVNDSVLDYFAWTGFMPHFYVMAVYWAVLLLTASLLVFGLLLVGLALRLLMPFRWTDSALSASLGSFVFWLVVLEVARHILFSSPNEAHGLSEITLYTCVGIGLLSIFRIQNQLIRQLQLKSLLLILLASVAITYPSFYQAISEQMRKQMVKVAASFAMGEEEGILEAMQQTLNETPSLSLLYSQNARIMPDTTQAQQLLTQLKQNLNDLDKGGFEVALTLLDTDHNLLYFSNKGANADADRSSITRTTSAQIETMFRRAESEAQSDFPFVGPQNDPEDQEQFRYAGLTPIQSNFGTQGWVLIRAEQRVRYAGENPFARYSNEIVGNEALRRRFSLAEYRSGVLQRAQGGTFAKTRLPNEVSEALSQNEAYWTTETVYDQTYQTYYLNPYIPGTRIFSDKVVTVRAPQPIAYDHLYYLLRVTLAGLVLLIPIYLIGVVVRWRKGCLFPERTQFRDRVLNAFSVVGTIAVLAMGIVGQQVVNRENQSAIRLRIERRLDRVGESLQTRIQSGELSFDALSRIIHKNQLDSLANALSLDLSVYRGADMMSTTRPELVRERVIPVRLPIEAYEQLYLQTLRNAYVENRSAKGYSYTVGYKSLTDANGVPQLVVGVIMMLEQEQIQEQRARTSAYQFGALLLLLLLVLGTGTILANALTRPLSSLRHGLESVAEGQLDQRLTVTSRDEVGELVETFNEMLSQLGESRKQLRTQERQLAWNEMARQVAHEIKNPLTPMKLSLQHLKRAQKSIDSDDPEARERFNALFARITDTLNEQIDTLTNIANSFSTFARLPKRVLEPLNLNASLTETLSLMEAEPGIHLRIDLHDQPMTVRADREELRRIFLNLVKNAMQAMPNGGEIHVTTQTEPDASGRIWAVTAIQDQGTGIPEEVREKIFVPNFSTKTSGMGLGLAIVRKSVEDMQGTIDFETESGKGTTFFVRLPLSPPNSAAAS